MLKTIFNHPPERPLKVLCLGAHSDDIEIGCGGTMLRLIDEVPQLDVSWVVLSANGPREEEARQSAELFLANVAPKKIVTKNFRDGFFPYNGAQIKDYFEELKSEVSPDLIFTHYRNDRHQDHRLVEELTWNTFRNHLILEYEIPKYDGDMGRPNYFVRLDEKFATQKIDYLHKIFTTQRGKYWFNEDVFKALMNLRGVEARSPSKYAEGFYAYKLVH